jgi:hypothetical protein
MLWDDKMGMVRMLSVQGFLKYILMLSPAGGKGLRGNPQGISRLLYCSMILGATRMSGCGTIVYSAGGR